MATINVLEDLKRLKPVKEEDCKSLVDLVDDVEATYNQLKELNHLNTLIMRDVDAISDLMPTHFKIDWRRKYSILSPAEKLQPFINDYRCMWMSLLGCDYFGLHPKQEEARCSDNLSIMSAALEICLQGTHPNLIEETKYDSNQRRYTRLM